MIERKFIHELLNLVAIAKGMTEGAKNISKHELIDIQDLNHKLERTEIALSRIEKMIDDFRKQKEVGDIN